MFPANTQSEGSVIGTQSLISSSTQKKNEVRPGSSPDIRIDPIDSIDELDSEESQEELPTSLPPIGATWLLDPMRRVKKNIETMTNTNVEVLIRWTPIKQQKKITSAKVRNDIDLYRRSVKFALDRGCDVTKAEFDISSLLIKKNSSKLLRELLSGFSNSVCDSEIVFKKEKKTRKK